MVAKVTNVPVSGLHFMNVPVLAMVTSKCQQCLSRQLFLPSSVLTRPQHSLFGVIVLSYN